MFMFSHDRIAVPKRSYELTISTVFNGLDHSGEFIGLFLNKNFHAEVRCSHLYISSMNLIAMESKICRKRRKIADIWAII